MSDARRNVRLYSTIKDQKSPLKGSRPSVPHGTNFLEIRTTEVVVTTGAISRAKLQSNRHHQQANTQTNTQLFTGPSCRPTNSVKALKGKVTHSMDCSPQSHLGSQKIEVLKFFRGSPLKSFLLTKKTVTIKNHDN